MPENQLPKWSEIPGIIKNHPAGLMIAIIVACLLLIFGGVLGCLTKILIRLPFNLNSPDRILAGDICNPDKIIRIEFAEWVLGLFSHEWFLWTVLIIGAIIFFYYKLKDK